MSSSRIRATVAATSMAAAAAVTGIVLATTAQAAETDDPRAVPVDGNATTCAQAGLEGDLVDKSDLQFDGGQIDSDDYVSITGVADGLTVTGIVVKGGDAYNVYEPGERGLSADVPWEDLVAPINNGGQQPQLSHWYVCAGDDEQPPTSEPPTSSEPSEPPTSTEPEPSEPPSSEPTSPEPSEPSEGPSGEPTSSQPGQTTSEETTTTTPAAVQSEDDDLALTGFDSAWLIPLGVLLLAGGGAAMWLARSRKRA